MPCKLDLHIFISKSKILSQFMLYGKKKNNIKQLSTIWDYELHKFIEHWMHALSKIMYCLGGCTWKLLGRYKLKNTKVYEESH